MNFLIGYWVAGCVYLGALLIARGVLGSAARTRHFLNLTTQLGMVAICAAIFLAVSTVLNAIGRRG